MGQGRQSQRGLAETGGNPLIGWRKISEIAKMARKGGQRVFAGPRAPAKGRLVVSIKGSINPKAKVAG